MFVRLDEDGFILEVQSHNDGNDPALVEVQSEEMPPIFDRYKVKLDNGKFVKTEILATPITYVMERMAAYPDVGEQMDMLWHAMDQGVLPKVEPFYTKIKTIKENYPKPANS